MLFVLHNKQIEANALTSQKGIEYVLERLLLYYIRHSKSCSV